MTILPDHQWKNRLILLFVPQANHVLRERQAALLRADQKGLDERDLLVFEIFPTYIKETPSAGAEEATELRRRYQIGEEDFVVLLIGKDGSEKLRSDTLVTRSELYTLIDAMPMRQEEMRKEN